MTKNTRNLIILAVLFVVCATLVIVFEIPGLINFGDETAGKLVSDIVPRVAVTVFLGALLLLNGYAESLKFRKNGFLRALVWCLPCFLVAFANFPYSALIRGTAVIVRADLVWLFLIKCLAIALMEELFFRATLVTVLLEFTEKKKYGVFITVIGSAAVFSLTHLLNLFYGAGFGATALQVGYTFFNRLYACGCVYKNQKRVALRGGARNFRRWRADSRRPWQRSFSGYGFLGAYGGVRRNMHGAYNLYPYQITTREN